MNVGFAQRVGRTDQAGHHLKADMAGDTAEFLY
jgi:hypothetical protein